MSIATLIDDITNALGATTQHTDDGYFGWTDRYGVRPSYFSGDESRHAHPRSSFIANYLGGRRDEAAA